MEAGVLEFLFKQLTTQGIWFGLFLYLFVKTDKTNKEREVKLEAQLDKSNEQLTKSIEALQDLKEVKETIREINNKIPR